MRWVPLLIAGIVIFSGCLDFLDEEDGNGAPQASANSEGGSNFEPNQEIVFTGKGSSDPDGDVLEYFWDFDKSDEKEESIKGNIANNGRITHSYENEGVYTVTLTVTDGNEFSTATTKVTIEEVRSEIKAKVTTDDETESKVFGEEQITYTFSASESESDSAITKYEWDFSYVPGEFNIDEETTGPDISWDFYSGTYLIGVQITNEMGESDESQYTDSIELRINYEYSDTRTINSGQQEHITQVYAIYPLYIRATLEYDDGGGGGLSDLDLYLYNTSQERDPDGDEGSESNNECNVCVAKDVIHNTSQRQQENYIEISRYSDNYTWFDDASELGDWWIVIDHERTGNPEYTVRIEVIYWE